MLGNRDVSNHYHFPKTTSFNELREVSARRWGSDGTLSQNVRYLWFRLANDELFLLCESFARLTRQSNLHEVSRIFQKSLTLREFWFFLHCMKTPISQTLNRYSGTPIFRKIREFNETQPPEQRVSYEILAQNGLLKCILTGETMNPLGNSNGFTLMEENGFVFFVKNELAEMVRKEGLRAAQKKFAANWRFFLPLSKNSFSFSLFNQHKWKRKPLFHPPPPKTSAPQSKSFSSLGMIPLNWKLTGVLRV